ncbi:MAG: HAMP domain-containing protein [Rhizobacter sp.]|nr:HAMP domain-containing protein [Ferruginibacter sp.]
MAISIKNKIRSGTFFLFLLLIVTGGVSLFYFINLRKDALNILRDNYESLEYSHQLLKLSDEDLNSPAVKKKIDALITLQENNITEPGEREVTLSLRNHFNNINNIDGAKTALPSFKKEVNNILQLNMTAIERKNLQVANTSQRAFNIIIAICVVIFLIAFVFLVNFPSIVVTPIQKLTEAIAAISAKNYSHRIHLTSNDEFQQLGDSINNMTDRLQEFENSNLNKIIIEKERAEAVINSLKDASIGINYKGKVLFANEQALSLLGLVRADIVDKYAESVALKNELLHHLLLNDSKTPFKIVVDNKENYYVKELIEVKQGDGLNKVIVLKNITSFKEIDVAKTNFIATVSHELKTPLASSDFSLKLLEDLRIGELSPEQKELVQQLKEDNQRMLKILSELLNMSQVESGKIQLKLHEVNVNELVHISVAGLQHTIREKDIKLDLDLQQLQIIQADADKITWVLNNFLNNAIKFSPENGIIIIRSYSSAKSITVSVKDEGPGIDAAYFDQIFERYYQIPGRLDKKGSGIGLAICKEMIQAMGGNTWVKSNIGQGSEFGFDIPVR